MQATQPEQSSCIGVDCEQAGEEAHGSKQSAIPTASNDDQNKSAHTSADRSDQMRFVCRSLCSECLGQLPQ